MLANIDTFIIICNMNFAVLGLHARYYYSHTHHYPHTMFCHCSPYRTLDICFLVISQSEQICKWGIKYAHLVTTDHKGSTSAHQYPHTKFRHCSPYTFDTELWIFAFVVISQSEQICKWGIEYAHLVMTNHVGSASAHHYPHTKFCHYSPCTELWIFAFLVISQSE